MQDGQQKIEFGSEKYAVCGMDEICDADLIQAHTDAMALDIEPESVDVEFAMKGLGSKVHTEKEMLKIT